MEKQFSRGFGSKGRRDTSNNESMYTEFARTATFIKVTTALRVRFANIIYSHIQQKGMKQNYAQFRKQMLELEGVILRIIIVLILFVPEAQLVSGLLNMCHLSMI